RTSRAADVYDGQTDAVYRDAALRDQLTGEPPRRPEAEGAGARREVDAHDLRDAVYVARNEVPAERPSRTHVLLEVHVGAGEPPWNGEPLRLLDQLDPEAAARHSRAVHHGQAAAGDGGGGAYAERVHERATGRDREAKRSGRQRLSVGDRAARLRAAGEHHVASGYATRPRTRRSSPIFSTCDRSP